MTESKYERPSWHRYGCNCYVCTKIKEAGEEVSEELIEGTPKDSDKVEEDA